MTARPTRVLIVDDSAVIRGLLTRAVESCAGLVVSGTAMQGEMALRQLERQPADVVLLDVEMPVMDGLATLACIQQRYPRLPVIMVSNRTGRGARATVRALALGAVGCIEKPEGATAAAAITALSDELIELIQGVVPEQPTPPTPPTPPDATAVPPPAPERSRRADAERRSPLAPRLVVIGSSTGGPKALSRVLGGLPAEFRVPIAIVQHMPPTFTPLLAKHLAADADRPCEEARDGEPIRPGRIYVAPGGRHLSVHAENGPLTARLSDEPPEHFCRPSVNPLFRSAARACGHRLVAVMLTGMGSDGLEGTRAVAEAGGHVIAQDEATSIVWGMPGTIIREGLARQTLPLDAIGPALIRIGLGKFFASCTNSTNSTNPTSRLNHPR